MTTILAGEVVAVAILLLIPNALYVADAAAPASATNSISDSQCGPSVLAQQSYRALNPLNLSANELAISSGQFAQLIFGYSPRFNSVFATISLGPGCTQTVSAIDVVYDLYSNGNCTKQLVVVENPSATRIMGVQLDPPGRTYGGTHQSNNWAGYELYNGTERTQTLYQGSDEFNLVGVSAPNQYACQTSGCDFAQWAGLSPYDKGTDSTNCPKGCIAQIGTDSEVTPSGSKSYFSWYEFLPKPSRPCNVTVSVSDQMLAASFYYSSSSTYELYLEDVTTQHACSVSGTTSGGAPYYAQFIAEDALGALARFSPSETITEPTVCTAYSVCHYGYYYYQSNWYWLFHMTSGQISVSAITPGPNQVSTWSETYCASGC